jgi:hypothetical protein
MGDFYYKKPKSLSGIGRYAAKLDAMLNKIPGRSDFVGRIG